MPMLDADAYKNIQNVVAELVIMVAKDTVVPLERIVEVIKNEADNIAAAGLSYAYNILETNQQEELEAEVELEEEDEEAGDWKDRKEDEEEETRAAN